MKISLGLGICLLNERSIQDISVRRPNWDNLGGEALKEGQSYAIIATRGSRGGPRGGGILPSRECCVQNAPPVTTVNSCPSRDWVSRGA